MQETIQLFRDNFLSGEELVQNKRTRYDVVDEYECYSKILPKVGKKFFESNGSWLQLKQIEKGLQHRRELIVIERVERKQQLAVSDWLPDKNQVHVIKKSGQTWAFFGTEMNCVLLLIPEEALMLLEMNSMQLLWEKFPMSVQQAYHILLNSTKTLCSLEQYKIYKQFVRNGYHLQRYSCSSSSIKKRTNTREAVHKPKMLISIPSEGLRTFNDFSKFKDELKKAKTNELRNNSTEKQSLKSTDNDNKGSSRCVEEIVDNIICRLETSELKTISKIAETFEPDIFNQTTCEKSKKSTTDTLKKNETSINTVQVVKNNDKDEIIELSDDEIEKSSPSIARQKILNQLPNIASGSLKVQSKSLNSYIPNSIQLQKVFYNYDSNADKCNTLCKTSTSKKQIHPFKQNNTENNTKRYSERESNFNPNSRYFYDQLNTHKNFCTILQQTNPFYNLQLLQSRNSNMLFQQFSHFDFLRNNRRPSNRSLLGDYNKDVVGIMGDLLNTFLTRNIFPPNNLLCIPAVAPSCIPRICNVPSQLQNRSQKGINNKIPVSVDNVEEPSNWQEFRKTLQDKYTITIDEEQSEENGKDKCNKKILHKKVEPLIYIKRNTQLLEINDKLKIIKTAADKPQGRRDSDCKILYNIYSNRANFRKTSPGPPNYHLLVESEMEDNDLNLGQMRHALNEKDKTCIIAYVSKTSTSFIHCGHAMIPDLI